MFAAKQFLLPFFKKEQIAQDVYSLYFDRTKIDFSSKGRPAYGWDFFPGQYIRMTLPISVTDGRGSSRFFTISSSPLEKNYIMITTKRGNSDFKKVLLHLLPGDAVKFFGPIGGFYLREEETHQHAFLAGGIGITPFHSMITYAAEKKLKIPITMFASFSTQQDFVFYEKMTNIAKERENIKIIYTITRPENLQIPWSGETGRISAELLKKYTTPDILKPTYYIVGPPAMVDGTEQLLRKMNIPEGQIKIEQFTGY